MAEQIPDKDRWLALLSYNEVWRTKEDANGIADWICSQSAENKKLKDNIHMILDMVGRGEDVLGFLKKISASTVKNDD